MRDVLRGIKVLEVAQWWLAPSAATLLAEWGADVVKVEHPVHGDAIRGLATSGALPGDSDFNFMLEQSNHGKRSIGLDIATPRGREILDCLVHTADVFVTNFLPSARQRLRIDVDDVRAVNPQIIYARAHGAGDRGPERDRGGFDAASFWARGSVAHQLTPAEARSPVVPRPSFGDGIGGMSLAGAIAAALFGRERHGEPSVIDVSLLGAAVWVMSPDVVAAGVIPGGLPSVGREAQANPISNTYRTADGRWIWLVMLQSDRHWPELCERLGRAELVHDERFATAKARAANLSACMAELEGTFASRPLDEWRERLAGIDGVWAPVQTPSEIFDDPQVRANGYVSEVDYGARTHRLVVGPSQFDGQPPELTPAPAVGQHTDDILSDIGLDWDAIIELKVAGVVT
ncbi:MAG: CoA transferase [Acidimicrobiaceae bacterium]|nr:CoA transferase [Acidimicrobiaceae bacterium]